MFMRLLYSKFLEILIICIKKLLRRKEKMKRILLIALFILASMPLISKAFAACTTIQNGTLLTSDGRVIETGFDEWGYNFKHICLTEDTVMPIGMPPGASLTRTTSLL